MGLGQFSATVVSELFIRMSAASCEKYGQNIVNRLYLLVFTGYKWFGPVTPMGGVAFMVGWVLLLVGAVRHSGAGVNHD